MEVKELPDVLIIYSVCNYLAEKSIVCTGEVTGRLDATLNGNLNDWDHFQSVGLSISQDCPKRANIFIKKTGRKKIGSIHPPCIPLPHTSVDFKPGVE